MPELLEKPVVTEDGLRSWQMRTVWLLWGAYASYYMCRGNFVVAQPMILREFATWTREQIGFIPSTYAAVYAVGQIVNGTLGQRYGARRMMTIALLIAAVTNFLFSYTSSLSSMRLLWAINGWGQSAGWALMVHTISNWNTSAKRGTLIGRLSTCYTVGNVLSWLLAGYLCEKFGWRAAFRVPSLFLIPMAVAFFTLLRDTPEEAGFAPIRDDVTGHDSGLRNATAVETEGHNWQTTRRVLLMTLSSRVGWILGIGFFVMNTVRYTFMNWSVQYMADFHGRSVKNSALTAVAIPLVGSLGALTAGWASDTLFGKRRAPVCMIMLFGLSAVCALMTMLPAGDLQPATLLLGLARFI